MLNENGETLIEHHTHYKELHGFDRTVWMTRSEHTKLHNRLRQEDKYGIADVLCGGTILLLATWVIF